MAKIFNAKNLEEALGLARNFRENGLYNLFRGQGKNWPVVSTAGRQSESSINLIKEQIERLYYFFDCNPLLNKYNKNVDWFYAVAQHYGLPTNYIDFTTDEKVAAYFATHSKSNKKSEDCVIICLNENDFNGFVSFTKMLYEKDKVIPPYITKIDVDNLWRLHAQSGCFLFTPYDQFEQYYDFDRILFPFEEPYLDLNEKDIYPERKSELEILLDQYFNSEKRIQGQRRLQNFVQELNIPVTRIHTPDNDKLLKQTAAHHSWGSSDAKKWNYMITEAFREKKSQIKLNLFFDGKLDKEKQIQTIENQLMDYFVSNKVSRSDLIHFEIQGEPKLKTTLARTINRSCCRIWDGTRNLPYTDGEISSIIAKYIFLEINEDKYDDTPSISGEEIITLELTNEYGSFTRTHASASLITASFRNDLHEILCDELRENITHEILLRLNNANIVFDFEKLLELFKQEVICYQVLYNSENENPVIFYTPMLIKEIGYA